MSKVNGHEVLCDRDLEIEHELAQLTADLSTAQRQVEELKDANHQLLGLYAEVLGELRLAKRKLSAYGGIAKG